MAADTALKRYSAMNISSPWRGLNVSPSVTVPAGERQALLLLYALTSVTPPVSSATDDTALRIDLAAINFGGTRMTYGGAGGFS